ncbi:3-hydroxyacyl-ACP dehydratase FabZ family protein [Autumnicola psychrophila]|uniref:3-hydroxyacyl-ACP dehydratase FabZ family protein n=1 Tax=Autumnicola psychrophila TaxID=3075592 RepID=A0ABU3DPR5_9FLAO|nr:3-hydroxyacyl-ACP dehydratase FabZ family protein [Zunongwangia sp. F225]MDT0685706.1 3-hydroxyacyl-ACP dehydratase FabZ family protein [Zunongwangia sp. F225]
MDIKEILSRLPYSDPFLFVDDITHIDENGLFGYYTFPPESFFYKGHFKDNPVTPGVILTECMAQIGLVCFGIFLLNRENSNAKNPKIALSSSEVEFYKPVFPGETVKVVSKKRYFRFNKLKCDVEMFNTKDEVVCKGTIAGMMKLSSE